VPGCGSNTFYDQEAFTGINKRAYNTEVNQDSTVVIEDTSPRYSLMFGIPPLKLGEIFGNQNTNENLILP
jgi:hypothetical protein